MIRRVFLRQAIKRMTVSMRVGAFPPAGGAPRGGANADYEGTAVDVEPRPGLGA